MLAQLARVGAGGPAGAPVPLSCRRLASAAPPSLQAPVPAAVCATLVVGLRQRRRAAGRPSRGGARTCLESVGNWPQGAATIANADEVLREVKWPVSWPYTEDDFRRADESDDVYFYNEPRLCTHIDDGAIGALRGYYAEVFPTYPNARILDICSSHISHYPEQKTWSSVSITGMNEYELKKNAQADDYVVRNLNVSFDYLNKPLEVMKEVGRVLKPGGSVILSTSNRCFPSKAVNIWLRTSDMEHILIYGSYVHFSGAFEPPEARNISAPLGRVGLGDPMYVIQARKKA